MPPARSPPPRGGVGGQYLVGHSRSLDSIRKGGTPPPQPAGKSASAFLCFDFKSFLGTLLALTIVMIVWKPYYENLLSATSRCSATAAASSTFSVKSNIAVAEREPELVNSPIDDPNNRTFRSYGSAADLFVQFGAYRGGANTFAVIGLASKPLHVYGSPFFKCEWNPKNGGGDSSPIAGEAYKILPDWGYGRVYTTVIVNCTFPENPNADNRGGKLTLYAYLGESSDRYEKLIALEELPGAYNDSAYSPPYQYEYLYCGSSLYGNLSSDRIREWMAYHAWFFGPRSHFVLHDAGGVTAEVRAVLEPYIKAGRVTLQDVRGQAAFDSYYYNQFVVVNDCLHRYRFAANWTFFFDVDEYIYIPDGTSLASVIEELSNNTQFTIDQYPMSTVICLDDPSQNYSREWGFEKLLFKDSRTHIWKDRKYAIQAKNAYATGIHMSENVAGGTLHKTETKIRYYHYHNSITVHDELCRTMLPMTAMNATTWLDAVPYVYDDTMKRLAPTIKQFAEDYIRGLVD